MFHTLLLLSAACKYHFCCAVRLLLVSLNLCVLSLHSNVFVFFYLTPWQYTAVYVLCRIHGLDLPTSSTTTDMRGAAGGRQPAAANPVGKSKYGILAGMKLNLTSMPEYVHTYFEVWYKIQANSENSGTSQNQWLKNTSKYYTRGISINIIIMSDKCSRASYIGPSQLRVNPNSSEWKSKNERDLKARNEENKTISVCVLHIKTIISTRRHPAHPVSTPAL